MFSNASATANVCCMWLWVNPFPHMTIMQQTTLNVFCQMDNLWLKVENIVTKGEITRSVQFLLLSLCFQNAVCFNPFPHTTILQQTTLNVFWQNKENLQNWMNNLWQKVENIVAKGEIARFVQFLLLSLCFQKGVCCRGVRKRLYEGKG